jgi:hypothetical protein
MRRVTTIMAGMARQKRETIPDCGRREPSGERARLRAGKGRAKGRPHPLEPSRLGGKRAVDERNIGDTEHAPDVRVRLAQRAHRPGFRHLCQEHRLGSERPFHRQPERSRRRHGCRPKQGSSARGTCNAINSCGDGDYRLHVAFEVALDDLMDAPKRLQAQGITPLSFFGAETTEPSVIGWMPAAALSFRNPDGHLLEYLTMLDEEPEPKLGIVSWSEWLAQRESGMRGGFR